VVDCAEVSRQFEQYRRSGRFHAGYALSLLQHEADPQVVHESTCPVLNSGDRMALEQYGRAFMGGEV
jgi:hypothetical protein